MSQWRTRLVVTCGGREKLKLRSAAAQRTGQTMDKVLYLEGELVHDPESVGYHEKIVSKNVTRLYEDCRNISVADWGGGIEWMPEHR